MGIFPEVHVKGEMKHKKNYQVTVQQLEGPRWRSPRQRWPKVNEAFRKLQRICTHAGIVVENINSEDQTGLTSNLGPTSL